MSLARSMVDHHVWLVGEMIDRAARLADDVLDRPIELSVEGVDDDPTLRSLLARLIGQMSMWELAEQGAAEYDLAQERGLSVDQMRAWLDDVGPRFRDLARRVDDEDLAEVTFVNTMCEHARLRCAVVGRDHGSRCGRPARAGEPPGMKRPDGGRVRRQWGASAAS
jgi:hypothetical protein